MRDAVRMRDAEKEALRLCPNSTVSLKYERQHVVYDFYDPPKRGTNITCNIWVAELQEHFEGPDEEAEALPA
ncbi:MAG: hypothetical protein ACOC43_15390 [Desulfohalobiaceae bacterium]